jgi:hypothetical protein
MSKATQRGGGDEEEEGEEPGVEDVAREERVVRRCAVATPLPGLREEAVWNGKGRGEGRGRRRRVRAPSRW